MAINTGTLTSYNIAQTPTSSSVGSDGDVRKLYNWGDRVAELAPEESPFFVYLNKVSKVPTDDPVFRYLENRSKIDWTSRNFYIAGTTVTGATSGSSYTLSMDDSSGNGISWLTKGMVFSVNTLDGTTGQGWGQSIFRIESSPTTAGTADTDEKTTFTAKCIEVSSSTDADDVADNDQCQVIGTSFIEGSGSPDVWANEIEDGFGYTQIFKTAAELTNTAIATVHRGYANEWDRIWALKLREHKVDIERAMLFSHKKRVGNIQYTEGVVGHIVKNSTAVGGDSDFTYTSGDAYFRTMEQTELTYDRLLSDFEVLFDPARGGGTERLGLASLPVISFFNKLGDGAFIDTSIGGANMPFRYNMKENQGKFGHKVLTIETIHGTLHLVKEPLFRGISSGFLLFCDVSNISYRPLVGNGLNRDTHIETNIQAADEDLRKDMILTEAGLEIALPELQMLYSVEDL